MKIVLLIASVVLLPACHFQRGAVREVHLVEFGIFQKTKELGDVAAPNVVGGQRHAVAEAMLVERTTNIHARRGTSFGVRVKLVGEPRGLGVPCTAKYLHPLYKDPATGRSSGVEQWTSLIPIGE